jgi:hypothetical protein
LETFNIRAALVVPLWLADFMAFILVMGGKALWILALEREKEKRFMESQKPAVSGSLTVKMSALAGNFNLRLLWGWNDVAV